MSLHRPLLSIEPDMRETLAAVPSKCLFGKSVIPSSASRSQSGCAPLYVPLPHPPHPPTYWVLQARRARMLSMCALTLPILCVHKAQGTCHSPRAHTFLPMFECVSISTLLLVLSLPPSLALSIYQSMFVDIIPVIISMITPVSPYPRKVARKAARN